MWLGANDAVVAIELAMLVIIWQMSRTGAFCEDPGPDYYIRRDPEHTNDVRQQLANLGYKVTIEAA